jgi:glycosyltransferase involved in cell wall biosynthesis
VSLDVIDAVQDRPLVSVVMSFHNARDTLARTIHSLLWQTYPNWELILLDDGSSDGSAEILESIEDPRIRLYGDPICRGLPTRLNQGIALAKGEYIARMDADDVAFPERFARQVAYLENNRNVDLLATAALLVNTEGRPVGVLQAGLSHEAICRRPWHGFPMPHPTWMGRADWFRKYPYDERASKAQDQALLYRTYRTSCFAGLPDVLLGYKYTGLSARKTLMGRYHYLRSMKAGGDARHRLFGTVSHTVAAVRDLLGLVFGLEWRVIKGRVQAADAGVFAMWDAMRLRLLFLDGKTESQ